MKAERVRIGQLRAGDLALKAMRKHAFAAALVTSVEHVETENGPRIVLDWCFANPWRGEIDSERLTMLDSTTINRVV